MHMRVPCRPWYRRAGSNWLTNAHARALPATASPRWESPPDWLTQMEANFRYRDAHWTDASPSTPTRCRQPHVVPPCHVLGRDQRQGQRRAYLRHTVLPIRIRHRVSAPSVPSVVAACRAVSLSEARTIYVTRAAPRVLVSVDMCVCRIRLISLGGSAGRATCELCGQRRVLFRDWAPTSESVERKRERQ